MPETGDGLIAGAGVIVGAMAGPGTGTITGGIIGAEVEVAGAEVPPEDRDPEVDFLQAGAGAISPAGAGSGSREAIQDRAASLV